MADDVDRFAIAFNLDDPDIALHGFGFAICGGLILRDRRRHDRGGQWQDSKSSSYNADFAKQASFCAGVLHIKSPQLFENGFRGI